MSRQVRNRVTATALGGFLLGAALLTTGTAGADQVAGGAGQVVFEGGGVFGLSCTSTPSVEALTVPADGVVRVVNHTGHAAKLRLNGDAKGSLPDDGSTGVVFRRGTTAVTLDPSCAVPDPATPVLVTATPAVPEEPSPTPPPSTSVPDVIPTTEEPSDPGTLGVATDDRSALPATVMPQRSSSSSMEPSATIRPTKSGALATRVLTRASRTATPRIKTRTRARGTAGAPARAHPDTPPGAARTSPPGVPAHDLRPAPASPAGPSSSVAAAEPVAALRPLPDPAPVGLLALIASVSVFGVSMAVIRAFVSQRASRS